MLLQYEFRRLGLMLRVGLRRQIDLPLPVQALRKNGFHGLQRRLSGRRLSHPVLVSQPPSPVLKNFLHRHAARRGYRTNMYFHRCGLKVGLRLSAEDTGQCRQQHNCGDYAGGDAGEGIRLPFWAVPNCCGG
ncbi:MAG: hypothetical protein KGJ56_08140 [Gammaproteobacteria bacterium]|nr:hypothetical protein [Gammaproteobacteria bacterium]